MRQYPGEDIREQILAANEDRSSIGHYFYCSFLKRSHPVGAHRKSSVRVPPLPLPLTSGRGQVLHAVDFSNTHSEPLPTLLSSTLKGHDWNRVCEMTHLGVCLVEKGTLRRREEVSTTN